MREANVFHVLCNYLNYPKLLNRLRTGYSGCDRATESVERWALDLGKLATYTQMVTIYVECIQLFVRSTGENSKILMPNIKHDDGQ